MSLLSHTPTASTDDAVRIAREEFGVSGLAHVLPGERDQNFRLDVGGVPTYVLKIANATESIAVLEAQHGAARCAAEVGIGVQVPRPTPAGADHSSWAGHVVRLMPWLPGQPLATVSPHSPGLLDDLGATLGRLARALSAYDHPAAHRDFHWDVARMDVIVDELAPAVSDPSRRAMVDRARERFATSVRPRMSVLRRGVIHGDANDLNVLVDEGGTRVTGLLDFGDLVWSVVVADLAVASAYVVHHSEDPLEAVATVAAGFHREWPLDGEDLAVLWELVIARQVLTACNAAVQHAARPDDPYLTISEAPAWRALERLSEIHPRLAMYRLRAACGLEPHPDAASVRRHLASVTARPLLGVPWSELTVFPVDLTLSSPTVPLTEASAPPEQFDRLIRSVVGGDRSAVGVGGYGENRAIYTAPEYAPAGDPDAERRSVHLAVDVWTPADMPVCAPISGRVLIVRDNAVRLDYGPVVVLEHQTDEGVCFFSLYGHLSLATLEQVKVGQEVAAGDVIGWVGTPPTNGDWAPHVHVQLILDLLDLAHDFPGVARPSQQQLWLGLSPDPALLIQVPLLEAPTGATRT